MSLLLPRFPVFTVWAVPVEYEKVNMRVEKGMKISRAEFIRKLIDIHYERTNR
jgi:excinuclease UvrABC helicase subunit UvrB